MTNTEYNTRPVKIRAIRLPLDFSQPFDAEEILEFASPFIEWDFKSGQWPVLKSANGNIVCNPGDWIIKNDKEAYPCNNDVFEGKYFSAKVETFDNPVITQKFFRHIKTGNIYEMLMVTNTTCKDHNKFVPTAVYKDVETEIVYSRPFGEFVSKFEVVV